jgi:rhodanese-related sulfurtransferase
MKPVSASLPETTWPLLLSKEISSQLIVDCRPESQYNIVHFEKPGNIVHYPLEELLAADGETAEKRIGGKTDGRNTVILVFVFCRSGVTSRQAVAHLQSLGISAVNVQGGVHAYKQLIDPKVPSLV